MPAHSPRAGMVDFVQATVRKKKTEPDAMFAFAYGKRIV